MQDQNWSCIFCNFININKNRDAEEYWKELYEKERGEKDALKDKLLTKAGYIENETIKKADSTLREKTQEPAKTLLNKAKWKRMRL